MSEAAVADEDPLETLASFAGRLIAMVRHAGDHVRLVAELRNLSATAQGVVHSANDIAADAALGCEQIPPRLDPETAAELRAQIRGSLDLNLVVATEATIASVRTLASSVAADSEAAGILASTLQALSQARRMHEDATVSLLDALERLAVAEAMHDAEPSRPAEDVFADLGWAADADG